MSFYGGLYMSQVSCTKVSNWWKINLTVSSKSTPNYSTILWVLATSSKAMTVAVHMAW